MTWYDLLWLLTDFINHGGLVILICLSVIAYFRGYWKLGYGHPRRVEVRCEYCNRYIATRPIDQITLEVCIACTKRIEQERARKAIKGRPIDVIAGVRELTTHIKIPGRRPTPKPMPSRDWLPPIINATSGKNGGRGGGNAAHNHGLIAPPQYDSPYHGDVVTRALLCDTGRHLSIVNGDPLMRCGICGLPRAEWDKAPPPPDVPLAPDPMWQEPVPIRRPNAYTQAFKRRLRSLSMNPEHDEYKRWKPWFDGGWPICGHCGNTLGTTSNGLTYNFCYVCKAPTYPCCPACHCPVAGKERPVAKLKFSGVLQRSHYGDPLCRLCGALDMDHPHNDDTKLTPRCRSCGDPHNPHIACGACRKCGRVHGPRGPCSRADMRLDNWITKV